MKNNVTSRSIRIEYDDPPVLYKTFSFQKKKSTLSKLIGKKEYDFSSTKDEDYTSFVYIKSGSTPYNKLDLEVFTTSLFKSLINQYNGIKPITDPNVVLDKYIKEQKDFIDSLTFDEQELLRTYTYKGDRVINNILRYKVAPTQPTEIVPHITKLAPSIKVYSRRGGEVETTVPTPSEIKKKEPAEIVGTLPLYINKFLNIFKKVPVLKKSLTVYRGIEGTEGLNIHDNQFLSTSYEQGPGRRFAGSKCCFLTITLQPGVRALFIEPLSEFENEKEILVGPPFKATVTKGANEKEYNVTISPVSKGGLTYKRKHKTRLTRRKQMKFKQ